MSTQLSIVEQETATFELIQRHAKMLSASTLVPKEFQGNMANCAIGLNIAKRLGADPFMVIQNIDVIHGRPSFRATFLIAMVNASGRFSPLQFRLTGEGPSRACVAHCKDKSTGEVIEGPEITMAMAKAEGWSTKAGSKWLTMPELMLRYRAAAFFARLYAPDITLGMQTSEENYDVDPEPRQATGRVVTENPMKIANPYAETQFADLPETNAYAEIKGAIPDMEEPVEVTADGETILEAGETQLQEVAERNMLVAAIRAAIKSAGINMSAFAAKVREAGLVKPGVQVIDSPIEDLRTIAANVADIAASQFIPLD